MTKTILLTFFVSVALAAFTAHLFLNPILGLFGLTAKSVEAVASMEASQRVVQQMRRRYDQKRIRVANRLATRSSKRVASTALAAATIGTAAVAVTMVSLEVSDYCEQKRELQEDLDILEGTETKFDVEQCIEAAKEDSKRILDEVTASSTSTVSKAMRSSMQFGKAKWDEVRIATVDAIQSTKQSVEALWDSARDWFRHKPDLAPLD